LTSTKRALLCFERLETHLDRLVAVNLAVEKLPMVSKSNPTSRNARIN
jgi:hypothetical protein